MADASSLAEGQAALQAGRWQDAQSHFELALSGGETADVLLGMGEAWWWLGQPRRAVPCYERGYVLSRRTHDSDRALWAAIWLALIYGADFGNHAAFSGWFGRAERVLREAGSSPVEDWLRLVQAQASADLVHSRGLAEQLLSRARRDGDFDLELCSLSLLGKRLVAMTEVEAGLALVDEAMAGTFGGERNRMLTAVFTCCDMISACDLAADIERASHWCRMAEDFIARYGCPFLHAQCRTAYGHILTALGHWPAAEQTLTAAVEQTQGLFPPLHASALAHLGELELSRGRLEQAEGLLNQVIDHPAAAASQARLRLARGETAVAIALLQRQLTSLAGQRLEQAPLLELLVEAQLAGGELAAAATAADQLDALARQHPRGALPARASRALGLVSAADGCLDTARRQLEQALTRFAELELPLETARTRLALAELLRERQPELAIAEAQAALAGFETLGAAGNADRADALLRALGVRSRIGPKKVDRLTRREQEVLQLLGHGLSNPQIARRLCISPKTASHHVSSVLAKLGLQHRAEAAAFAARRGVDGAGAAHAPSCLAQAPGQAVSPAKLLRKDRRSEFPPFDA